jgi:parallel beta-helix repeat protein
MLIARSSFSKASSFCSFAIAITLLGCGEDERASAVGGASGNGGAGGSGGASAPATCDIALSPGDSDTETLQTALIEADPDSTICLQPGTYSVNKELTLTGTAGITVRGIGASRDDVVLDFANQDGGDEAMDVQADRFTLESVTLKDPPGDGVKVSNSDRPTFRDIKAYWSAGSETANGAYALYPALSDNVLIEHCEVVGASDAGIYLGQSATGIVRHNKAYGNVVGIEAENSTDVAIYDNEAWDNTCGILVVNLPGLTKKVMRGASVFDNLVYDNNRENFAEEGAFVGSVPRGTGILIAMAHDTQVYANTLRDNGGPAVLILSWPTIAFLTQLAANDDQYDQFSEGAYVHDNVFSGNGATPPVEFTGEPLSLTPPIEAILWDGFVDATKPTAGLEQRRQCIVNNTGVSFRNFNVPDLANPSTDLAAHTCAHAPLPRVVLK